MADDKANIYQVVIRGKVQDQDYRNVIHFGSDLNANDGNWDPILLQLATAIFACYVEILLPILPTTVVFNEVGVKRIYPALTDELVYAVGAGAGEDAGQSLPSFCASKVELRTGVGGRRNRGRMFLPPMSETNSNNNFIAQAGMDVLAAFVACVVGKFVGASATTPFRIGVLSRAAIKTGTAIPAAFQKVKALTASNVTAVMRRRKIGHGS